MILIRLAHLLWEQGVVGSNPATPTDKNQGVTVKCSSFFVARMGAVELTVAPQVSLNYGEIKRRLYPWVQNQRMTFTPTEEKQTIHIWMFYKMFQDFFNLPPYKKQFNRRCKKGELGLSLCKIFLVSKLIYFTRLSTNTKFNESDENLRGYISLHKGRIINK